MHSRCGGTNVLINVIQDLDHRLRIFTGLKIKGGEESPILDILTPAHSPHILCTCTLYFMYYVSIKLDLKGMLFETLNPAVL